MRVFPPPGFVDFLHPLPSLRGRAPALRPGQTRRKFCDCIMILDWGRWNIWRSGGMQMLPHQPLKQIGFYHDSEPQSDWLNLTRFALLNRELQFCSFTSLPSPRRFLSLSLSLSLSFNFPLPEPSFSYSSFSSFLVWSFLYILLSYMYDSIRYITSKSVAPVHALHKAQYRRRIFHFAKVN